MKHECKKCWWSLRHPSNEDRRTIHKECKDKAVATLTVAAQKIVLNFKDEIEELKDELIMKKKNVKSCLKQNENVNLALLMI